MNFYERLFSRNEVKVFPGRKMIKFLTLITFLAITIVACLRSWWFFNLCFFFSFVRYSLARWCLWAGKHTKKTASCAGSIPGKRDLNFVPRGPFCHALEKSIHVADQKDRGLWERD